MIIRTVCGDINGAELGFTSMHEHTVNDGKALKKLLLHSVPAMIRGAKGYQQGADIGIESKRRENLPLVPKRDLKSVFSSISLRRDNPARKLSDVDYYANELKAFYEIGGRAICDCSPMPVAAPLADIAKLSEQSGVRIVTCAGFYTKPSIPKKSDDALYAQVESYLENGDGSSNARPGFVKCAVSQLENERICRAEMTAVRVCAEAAKKNGLSLHIHTAFPLRKVHIIAVADMLEHESGINPTKVVFCHMDSFNIGTSNMAAHINADGYDIALPTLLADRGFNIGLDTWGNAVSEYELHARRTLLLDLISHGFTSRVVLGHDMFSKAKGIQNNAYGYTLFPEVLEDMIHKQELDETTIDMLTVTNPMRILMLDG